MQRDKIIQLISGETTIDGEHKMYGLSETGAVYRYIEDGKEREDGLITHWLLDAESPDSDNSR
jgi:hypothetical protein